MRLAAAPVHAICMSRGKRARTFMRHCRPTLPGDMMYSLRRKSSARATRMSDPDARLSDSDERLGCATERPGCATRMRDSDV